MANERDVESGEDNSNQLDSVSKPNSRVRDSLSWKQEAAYFCIGIPIICFSTLSGVVGGAEISRFALEELQATKIIRPLTENQVRLLTDVSRVIPGASGFIGGFVMTKGLIESRGNLRRRTDELTGSLDKT